MLKPFQSATETCAVMVSYRLSLYNLLLKSVMTFYTVVLPSTRQCMYSTVCGCISKGVSFMLPIVDYYLKELCNTIIKFKGMFAC